MTDNSFICAQGNKTMYYEQSEKRLYVFGNNDNCNLYKIVWNDKLARDDYMIVPPYVSKIHPNASLYEIPDRLYLTASGPNCSFLHLIEYGIFLVQMHI